MTGKKPFILFQYVFIAIIIILIVFSTIKMDFFLNQKNDAQPEKIKEAILKACVQCYALEGSYPPDLNYLNQHYGIILDRERYFYYYEIFASNLMPDVEVYEKGK